MTGRKLALWVAGHPMTVVLAILGLSGAIAAAAVMSLPSPHQQQPSAQASQYRVAKAPLPLPTGHAPPDRVGEIAAALRTVNRFCDAGPSDRSSLERAALRRAVDRIGDFADRYPTAGFDIDDQRTSSLAVLIVVRQELVACAPSMVSAIAARIPAQYQGD